MLTTAQDVLSPAYPSVDLVSGFFILVEENPYDTLQA